MSGALAIRHSRVSLALHTLRGGAGRPLLCLHGLRGRAADWQPLADAWPGPVYALDFAGHGGSGWLSGGAYSPELLAGDADLALARLGDAWLAGAGLGAYVALLVAGARPAHVPGALLLPGPGLGGAGALPDPRAEPHPEWRRISDAQQPAPSTRPESDPLLVLLETDFRPPDYAEAFAARARRLLLLEDGGAPPPWWEAVAKSRCTERISGSAAEALARLAL
jgi:pimeloyl-ACP methyl ester carboxylesterase